MAGNKRVRITETGLRDAHQSLIATRMRTDDMLPVLEYMDNAGYWALEMWGGATFDSAMRFLDEDPWERLRLIRARVKNAKLQMLLRGQNLVGYRHYADDVVREFVKKAVGNGIDIIRCFDALNDLRNVEVAAEQIKREGAHLQLCMSYTLSPVHTLESFAGMAKKMQDMGADSIAIKDMAGLIGPIDCAKLVKAIREKVDIPIELHSHYTTGLASMAYFAGIEAGAEIVDTAISPFALGTSQPPTESIVAALEGSEYDTGIKIDSLMPITMHFKKLREKYKDLLPEIAGVDINILRYQIPGGMYSNMVNQLREMNALDKLEDVLNEVPVVRKAMGYPPLVTPSSQMVGTQATVNVLRGRWKSFPKEIRQYFLGYYGQPPAPVDPEVQKLAIGNEEPITCRPGEKIPPEMEKAREESKPWATEPEDVLTWIMFPQVAKDFLPKKYARVNKRDSGLQEQAAPEAYPA